MLDLDVNIDGEDEFRRILETIPEASDVAIEDAAKTIRNLVIGASPKGDRPKAERFKFSWSDVEKTDGGWTFSNPKPYGQVLERGLYPGVGPRTTSTGGGIFSRQAPGGIVGPLFEDRERIRNFVVGVADIIVRQIRQAGGQ